jgi:hypothetical protein
MRLSFCVTDSMLNVRFKYIQSESSTQTTPKWMARVVLQSTAYFGRQVQLTSLPQNGDRATKVYCVLIFHERKYAMTVQRQFGVSTGEIHRVNHYIVRFGVQVKMNGPTNFQISLSVNFFFSHGCLMRQVFARNCGGRSDSLCAKTRAIRVTNTELYHVY